MEDNKKKNFLFEMKEGENRIIFVILQNPVVKEGVVTGTKVGIFAGIDDTGEKEELLFRKCEPIQFYAAGGAWAMEEYHKPLN
jgi:hypothetical protein